MKRSLLKSFRSYFFTGLLVLVPLFFTGYVAWHLFLWLDSLFSPYVIMPVQRALGHETAIKLLPGLGLLALTFSILLIGIIARNYFGGKLFKLGDYIILKIPGIRQIYSTFQQISHAFLSEKSDTFKRAVLFEYPRQGMYSIGFITQDTRGIIQKKLDENAAGDCFSIFLPTTPNPTSGYLLFVPKDQVIELNLTVEEALKLIISGGAIIPQEKAKLEKK